MIIDEELYLEHFGIRGMRWGIRNERDDKTEKKKLSRNKKLAIGGVVAAGAITAGVILSRRGQTNILDVARSRLSTRGRGWVDEGVNEGSFDILMDNVRHEESGRGQGFRNRHLLRRARDSIARVPRPSR